MPQAAHRLSPAILTAKRRDTAAHTSQLLQTPIGIGGAKGVVGLRRPVDAPTVALLFGPPSILRRPPIAGLALSTGRRQRTALRLPTPSQRARQGPPVRLARLAPYTFRLAPALQV